ncbi:hypothetical protein VOI54_07720 [Tamlana sp. 2201CG12-4]|uniref:hypothetical protein n=1 Tax=Tamlana sp. 2201CG12-4 TaxID=3112582 RepID=UPI002DB9D2A2|nr:hypothetical protein [Tamlana sp. 2201CG12-4]MEC3906903.1 hypothetical protein [Tamlana sp. 2201CG12-4]
MKTKFFSILMMCFVVSSIFSQTNLNKYKYVIVPWNFDFLKQKDQYQLNSLTQFLFNKYGFNAIMEGEDYPEDLQVNRCLGLKSDVIKDSGMFKTKLNVVFKDCNDRVVYTSEVGESREKDYKSAYSMALRDAFKSIEALNYNYVPNESVTSLASQTVAAKTEVSDEIQALKQEIETLKKEKASEAVVEVAPNNKPIVVPVTLPEEVEGDASTKPMEASKMEEGVKAVLASVLYAQEIENGFQLVDSSPKVVYKIKKTNLDNVFLVENKSAIVFKKGDEWILEFYEKNVLKQETLNIKF